MNNAGSVIVYRSRQEENMDYFLNEMLFPWLYNNWWIPALILAAGIIWYNVAKKKRRN